MNPIYYLYSTNLNLALNNIFYFDFSCTTFSPCTYTIFYFSFYILIFSFFQGSDIFALSIFILHVNGFPCEIWVNIYGTKTCALFCYPMRERKTWKLIFCMYKDFLKKKKKFYNSLVFFIFKTYYSKFIIFDMIWLDLVCAHISWKYENNICFEKLV